MKVKSEKIGRYLTNMIPHIDASLSDLQDTGRFKDISEEELFDGVKQAMVDRGYKDAENIDLVNNIEKPEPYMKLIISERYGDIPDKYEDEIQNKWMEGVDKYIENKK